MIALLQRVAEARVEVEGRVTGRIGRGLLLFVCAEPDDTDAVADKLVDKVLRHAHLRRRRRQDEPRPRRRSAAGSWSSASSLWPPIPRAAIARAFPARPARAGATALRAGARRPPPHAMREVAGGEFGADMQVHLVNDGPVTIPLTACAA